MSRRDAGHREQILEGKRPVDLRQLEAGAVVEVDQMTSSSLSRPRGTALSRPIFRLVDGLERWPSVIHKVEAAGSGVVAGKLRTLLQALEG